MQLVSYLVQKFYQIPAEDFSSKIIMAISIFKAISDPNKKDFRELKAIRQNTNKDVMVNIYTLDRNINPYKGAFKIVSKKFKFLRNDYKIREMRGKETHIVMTDDQIQYYCCLAIERATELVTKNIREYGDEIKFDIANSDKEGESIGFTKTDK